MTAGPSAAAGAVVAGPATIRGTAPNAGGRVLDWRASTQAGPVAAGSLRPDADGTFTFGVPVPVGVLDVTFTLHFPDQEPPGVCPSTTASFTGVAEPRATTWASGASGSGVADGSFGAWRGTPAGIGGFWVDNNEAQVALWQIQPGGEWAGWRGDLDIAVGAIQRSTGETWAAAARGAYDARWTASLTELARLRSGLPGTVYLRFAHEFNGDWTDWSVTAADAADFRAAWIRYRALQQRIFPSAQLVFCPSFETAAATGLDWRAAFPGARYVDVMGVDLYNWWPYVGDEAGWQQTVDAVDRFGAPRGLESHRRFAASVGLPFAVPEWGQHADWGDSGFFVRRLHGWFADHAGPGPGGLRYEVLFDVVWPGNPWALWPATRMPRTADAYREAF